MKYKIMYLPVDEPLTDGFMVINHEGEEFVYSLYEHERLAPGLKRAELFIVSIEYNTMVVVGRPSTAAKKWLTAGMEVKAVDCVKTTPVIDSVIIRIKCPVCHELH